jgi:hypothetical protein
MFAFTNERETAGVSSQIPPNSGGQGLAIGLPAEPFELARSRALGESFLLRYARPRTLPWFCTPKPTRVAGRERTLMRFRHSISSVAAELWLNRATSNP